MSLPRIGRVNVKRVLKAIREEGDAKRFAAWLGRFPRGVRFTILGKDGSMGSIDPDGAIRPKRKGVVILGHEVEAIMVSVDYREIFV